MGRLASDPYGEQPRAAEAEAAEWPS
jgi:hypothetical protein